ncbi:MAG: formate dehydrogenase accessory protein FdhD [Candidatus Fraserbacteria bacterium RBG_16_55_9]|uniref:Sulfur carrier protein FdhD n=1 Tax=Fraserbacteria sp. (strain RBG_16_55_9) TaxID=1817864 RepID=A0A1F5UZB5_FRAXR|nr:MAG: formate dehydrogenase accessory protein FdhD [Candidatus Fraserbacteria bacterium RBG_16_55_9]
MPRRRAARVQIEKVRGEEIQRKQDAVAVEEPLEIRLAFAAAGQQSGQSISITMRTPGDDFELAAGFLFSEGIIQSGNDIQEIRYCMGSQKEMQEYNVVTVQLRSGLQFNSERLLRHFYTTSSCGVCGKASLEALQIRGCPVLPRDRPIISAKIIHQLPQKLKEAQAIFKATGGLHAAGLFDSSGDLITLREDVGRHNAVDKLIGERLLAKKIPLHEHLMIVSGRASFEILQKTLMAGIPMVAAVGAPSSLGIDLAREFGMTLLGFVREKSFNIYAGPQRVRFADSSTT